MNGGWGRVAKVIPGLHLKFPKHKELISWTIWKGIWGKYKGFDILKHVNPSVRIFPQAMNRNHSIWSTIHFMGCRQQTHSPWPHKSLRCKLSSQYLCDQTRGKSLCSVLRTILLGRGAATSAKNQAGFEPPAFSGESVMLEPASSSTLPVTSLSVVTRCCSLTKTGQTGKVQVWNIQKGKSRNKHRHFGGAFP